MVPDRREVKAYLGELKKLVRKGRYRVAPRDKNAQVFVQYIFSEKDMRKIVLGLRVEDFCNAVYNEHSKFDDEVLYIFGKNVRLTSRYECEHKEVSLYIKINKPADAYVIIISFHEQEYPLTYRFKQKKHAIEREAFK